MDSELRDLRERVEMLERALSSRHLASGRFCRPDAPVLWGFGALVALAVVAVIFDLPITVRGAGPTTVTAPFVIKEASGRVLVTVDDGPGGGQLRVYSKDGVVKGQFAVDTQNRGAVNLTGGGPSTTIVDATGMMLRDAHGKNVSRLEATPDGTAAVIRFFTPQGQTTAELGSQSDGTGGLRIFGKGAQKAEDWKVSLGVFGDRGVLTLNGLGKRALGLTGNAQIFGRNGAGKEVLSLGVDNADQGYFSAMNTAGAEAGTLSVDKDNGTGVLQLFRKDRVAAAVVGTRDGNTAGDVCVNGPRFSEKGSVCLSILGIKNMMPY